MKGVRAIIDQLRGKRTVRAVAGSQLFDGDWYRATYPDVRAKGVGALAHYLRRGASEGRNPNPFFDSKWYLDQHSDVRAAGLNPLVHYVLWGAAERRRPSPTFDNNFYLEQFPVEERAKIANPLSHYLKVGRPRGLRINQFYHPELDEGRRDRLVQCFGDGRPTILMVMNDSLGGGTEKHVRDLAGISANRTNILRLGITGYRSAELCPMLQPAEREIRFDVNGQWDLLIDTIVACGVKRVHVHHLIGGEYFLHRLLERLALPFDVTLHDYYVLSPQPFLVGLHARFVGEDLTAAFPNLVEGGVAPVRPGSLRDWQARTFWLLREASRVIVPSADMAARIRQNVPGTSLIAAAHPEINPSLILVPRSTFEGEGPLRVGLIGAVTPYKGLNVLVAVADIASQTAHPLEFHLFGPVTDEVERTLLARAVKVVGEYHSIDLPDLIRRAGLHTLWYPAQCPESFSYALSEGIQMGLPIVVPDIGAFPERVANRQWTWIRPWDTSPADWVAFFRAIRDENFATGTAPVAAAYTGPPAPSSAFYECDYFDWLP